jgi:hypothetical protein
MLFRLLQTKQQAKKLSPLMINVEEDLEKDSFYFPKHGMKVSKDFLHVFCKGTNFTQLRKFWKC